MSTTPIKDARIDQIGFADELKKQFVDNLREGVKTTMASKEADRATGEFFEAVLASASSREFNTEKFLALCAKKKINGKELASMLNVAGGEAAKHFTEVELRSVSQTKSGSPSLRITRKKDLARSSLAGRDGRDQRMSTSTDDRFTRVTR